MQDRKKRIRYLKLAADGINPLSKKNPQSTIDEAVFLKKLQNEGLVIFTPNKIPNSSSGLEITDIGHKRLDEMKRSRYPDWLKWGALSAIVAVVAILIGLGN